eukprot:TRINITY_DN7683_c0_g2_i1.p1 TRINITY_DN7683_c0_g2~~TRINITY_DN7683_c0_g2_i1.p1  ORF type:complete len:572 (+),score=105.45 TRINITY_DN7683_c0_g2_i1:76-1791(+)
MATGEAAPCRFFLKLRPGLATRQAFASERESLPRWQRHLHHKAASLSLASTLLATGAARLLGRRRSRRFRQGQCAVSVQVDTLLSVPRVAESWAQAEALGKAPQEIAQLCALLCCVQRQLGYWAALHEGAVGSGKVVSKAPPLPLILSWEGTGGPEEMYGMSLADNGGKTLLQQLLNCGRKANNDKRWGAPGEEANKNIKAKVSLLRDFVDISTTPSDWTPGTHGLWYSDGTEAQLVYLPEVAEQVVNEESASDVVENLLRTVRSRQPRVEADSDEAEAETSSLPEGHSLFRFEALQGECSVSALPSLRTRTVSDEHMRDLLYAQARILARSAQKLRQGDAPLRYGMLCEGSEDPRVRAFVVPNTGVYSNSETDFSESLLENPPAGLSAIRRVFVLAPVWDCYIDGCGIPEQRCAWYGKVPLDIPELERLRSSKAFQELTVEQDERERAVEALLPLVRSCLPEDQLFTLVPVLVGGLMTEKAEIYTKLLAPFIADPENLFIVGGDVESLADGFKWQKAADLSGGPERFMLQASSAVNRRDIVVPVFSALELFLAVLAQSPRREQLSMTRYW